MAALGWRRLFPRVEVQLSENRLRVTDLETGAAIERAAITPFSSATKLVAEAAPLSALLHAVIVDLEGRRRFFSWPRAIIRPMGTLTPAERQVLADLTNAMGFRTVSFTS